MGEVELALLFRMLAQCREHRATNDRPQDPEGDDRANQPDDDDENEFLIYSAHDEHTTQPRQSSELFDTQFIFEGGQ